MIFTKIFLVIIVVVAIINETESTHSKYQNDPYSSAIKALKAQRKAEKYRLKAQKYAPRPQPRPDGFGGNYFDSDESGEAFRPFRPLFEGPFQSQYPGFPPFFGSNRPGGGGSSGGSSSGGNGGGSNGGGHNGGGNNGGGNAPEPQYPILQPGNDGSRLRSGGGGGGDLFNGFLGLLQGVIKFQ